VHFHFDLTGFTQSTPLQDCMAVRHEAVQESVPEAVKNMLLVLASSGVLTPQWRVSCCLQRAACCGWPVNFR